MTGPAVVPPVPAWLPAHLLPFWVADLASLFRALIVGEAEGEPWTGKLAVGYAAMNRSTYATLSGLPWFHPDNQRENVLARYQFSCFWSDYGVRETALDLSVRLASRYGEADAAARAVLNFSEGDPTAGADHYYNPDACQTPAWAVPLFDQHGHLVRPPFTKTAQIGKHVFYSSWS